MILKGSQRGGGANLAAHLTNTRENDHVDIAEERRWPHLSGPGPRVGEEHNDEPAGGCRHRQPAFSRAWMRGARTAEGRW